MSTNEQPPLQSLFKRPVRGCALCDAALEPETALGCEVSFSCDWCYRDFCPHCTTVWLRRISGCFEDDVLFLCKECDSAGQYGCTDNI